MTTTRFVYLDTHDYSKFADAAFGFGHSNLLPIYEELCQLADEGYFQFCFSQVIVSEVLQTASESLEIAKRKANVLERLCGARAFPNPFWLFKQELFQRNVFGTSSSWLLPEKVVSEGRWLQEELRSATKGKFEYESLIPWFIRPFARWLIRRMGDEKLRASMSTHRMFPLLLAAELDGAALDFLKGRMAGEEFLDRLGLALAYPSKLVWEPNVAKELVGLNAGMREFGDKMVVALNSFRSEIDKTYKKIGVPPPASMIEEQGKRAMVGLWMNVARRQLSKDRPSDEAYLQSKDFVQLVSETRFVRLFAEIMMIFMREAASVAKVRRRFRKGDGGDIMHALYVPHCRVMRADGDFAERIRRVAAEYGCTIVGKLEELPRVLHGLQESSAR